METKICNKCKKILSIKKFYKNTDSKDKLQRRCIKCYSEYSKRRYSLNRERIKQQVKQYYQINKHQINFCKNKSHQIRRKKDINFRISDILRNRTRQVINGNYKSAPTLKLLGCSIEKLREHLEKQFQQGMNWGNLSFYGWHIDHIRPCASYDLSKPEEQQKCFHNTNLQPLWAEENMSKGDKYNES